MGGRQRDKVRKYFYKILKKNGMEWSGIVRRAKVGAERSGTRNG